MNKKNILIIAIIILILLLIPIPNRLKDGGSIEYNAVLYSVTKYHSANPESTKGYDDGWKIKILGLTIYDEKNTYVSTSTSNEHIISIKTDNKIIDANTGSFCYKNGTCIDKIDFQDFSYDVLTTYYNEKVYIENLDGTIKSIELFDYSYKEFTKTKVEFTDEYIIMPNTSGPYIFVINAIYENKNIKYYFMANINEINGTDLEVIMQLKENTLSNTGLTIILKNQSNIDIQYGNPYSIEKYQNGYWKTVELINDMAFTLPAYELKTNESKEININWEYGYGKLPSGKYRIVKNFNYEENEKYVSFIKYLEFEIK